MKSLAFLFPASIIFLFVSLALSEGQSPPSTPLPQERAPASPPVTPKAPKVSGSAKQETPRPRAAIEKPLFAEALASDDLCRAVDITYKFEYPIKPESVRTILGELEAPAELQLMFAENGPLFGPVNPGKKFASTFLQFIYALRLGGLFQWEGSGPQDPELGRRLLSELAKENPGNGAFPFFLMGMYQGADDSVKNAAVAKAAEQVARSSFFDTLIRAPLTELRGTRLRSATHFYVWNNMHHRLRAMLYHPSSNALESLPVSLDERRSLQRQIGSLMMEEGRRAILPSDQDGYDDITYDYGTQIHPEEAGLRSYELSNLLRGGPQEPSPYVYAKNCDRTQYDAYYEKMRGLP